MIYTKKEMIEYDALSNPLELCIRKVNNFCFSEAEGVENIDNHMKFIIKNYDNIMINCKDCKKKECIIRK